MKTLISIAALGLALAAAGTASAADPVVLSGTAEASCTLPDTWTVTNFAGGANSSQLSGTTWTIPAALVSDTTSTSAVGGAVSLRVRAQGFCNTSHRFSVQSGRGGLVAGDPAAAVPTGFSRRRPVRYDAFWSNGSGGAFGPAISGFTPSSTTLSRSQTYTVSAALAPPGPRDFDFRMSLDRPSPGETLIAGTYSETVTITLSPIP